MKKIMKLRIIHQKNNFYVKYFLLIKVYFKNDKINLTLYIFIFFFFFFFFMIIKLGENIK